MLQPLGAVSLAISLIAGIYALVFGMCEALGLPFRPFGLAWQVPAHWLKGRSARMQALIWGACLGPGLLTRNPYAGMWLLPLLLPLIHGRFAAMSVGIAIGVAHGGGRAFGVLRNRKHLNGSCTDSIILTQWRWRLVDGLALLLVAGSLASII